MKRFAKWLLCQVVGHDDFVEKSTIYYVDKVVEITICQRCRCKSSKKTVFTYMKRMP